MAETAVVWAIGYGDVSDKLTEWEGENVVVTVARVGSARAPGSRPLAEFQGRIASIERDTEHAGGGEHGIVRVGVEGSAFYLWQADGVEARWDRVNARLNIRAGDLIYEIECRP